MSTRKSQRHCCVGTFLPFSYSMGIGTVLQQDFSDGLIPVGGCEHERGDSSNHRIDQCRIFLPKDNKRDLFFSFYAIYLIRISAMGKQESHTIFIPRQGCHKDRS